MPAGLSSRVALEQFRPLLGERGLLGAPSLFHFRYSRLGVAAPQGWLPRRVPQPIASFAGLVIVIITQAWLVLSGNFSWLNFVTIVLAAPAFDDAALARVLPLDRAGTTGIWSVVG